MPVNLNCNIRINAWKVILGFAFLVETYYLLKLKDENGKLRDLYIHELKENAKAKKGATK